MIDARSMWAKLGPWLRTISRALKMAAVDLLGHPWRTVVLALVLVFILCGMPPWCHRNGSAGSSAAGASIYPNLGDLGFTSPTSTEKPLPVEGLPDKPVPHLAVQGTGTVQVADSILPVSLELIEYDQDHRGVRVRVGEHYVVFDNLNWWESTPSAARWRGVTEVSLLPNLDIGLGIAYRMCSVSGVHVGPAVVVSQHLDWGAGEVRAWRYLTNHVSVDAALGYRISACTQGPHIALGLGVDL